MAQDRLAPEPNFGWRGAALVVTALLGLPVWSLIAMGFTKGRGAFDQLNYHEQAVRRFAEQLPWLDYSNYLSATTPGYHTFLSLFARAGADGRWMLQLIGSGFAIALVWLLARGVGKARGAGPGLTVALVLPFASSMAIVYSGVWMLPDNAGWLGVLAAWLLALRARFDAWTLVGGAAVLATLVFVRQVHLWPLAMLLTAAWLGNRQTHDEGFDFASDMRTIFSEPASRAGRAAMMMIAGIPAIGIVLWFWSMWGTLTPPVFAARHVGANPTAPAFVLAIFGACSFFFVPFLGNGLRTLWVRHTWVLALACLGGLAIALVAPSDYDKFAGRYSGIWEIAKRLPAPGDRSVVIVPLALLGSVLLAAWFVTLEQRDRWIMLAALVAFVAAQCVSHKLWQRYTEPFVLMWLALAASRVGRARDAAGDTWRALGPLGLALCMAGVTTASLVTADPPRQRELRAPWEDAVPMVPGLVPREEIVEDLGPSGPPDEAYEGAPVDR